MVSLLNSQEMKSCKSWESFCLSILFTQMIGPLFDMFTGGMFIFSSVQAYRTGWGWWMQGDSVPFDQKFSCKWNLSFFKAAPSSSLSLYLGSPFHIIRSIFSHFCLFQNAILHKILQLGFWNFKPFFSECSFHWLQHFFL